LPVVNAAGHLVGMVSEGDLMHKEIAPKLPGSFSILGSIIYLDGVKEYKEAFRKFSARTAAELMTAKVISVNEDEDVSRVGQIMLDHHIKRVPVLSDGRLVGIVSRQDVVKMLLR
jgi:CBS domain-containing protein